jgi:chromosome segregation ATPase
MKLSKNKIKQLLKVKNQSQKRIKKNKNLHVRNKSAKAKKPLNLRHKTLRNIHSKLMKGGGAKGSRLRESDIEPVINEPVQQDFTYYKAKFLEDKGIIDKKFKKDFTSFIDKVNNLEVQFYPELFKKGTLNTLKSIMQDKKHKRPLQEDKTFINAFIKEHFDIVNINDLQKLGSNVNKDLKDVITLFNKFILDVSKLQTLTPPNSEYIEKKKRMVELLQRLDLSNYIFILKTIAFLYNKVKSNIDYLNSARSKDILTIIILVKKIRDASVIKLLERYLKDIDVGDASKEQLNEELEDLVNAEGDVEGDVEEGDVEEGQGELEEGELEEELGEGILGELEQNADENADENAEQNIQQDVLDILREIDEEDNAPVLQQEQGAVLQEQGAVLQEQGPVLQQEQAPVLQQEQGIQPVLQEQAPVLQEQAPLVEEGNVDVLQAPVVQNAPVVDEQEEDELEWDDTSDFQAQEREVINNLAEKLATLNNDMQELDTKKREVEQELDMYKQMGESAYNTAKGQVTTIGEMQDKINTLEKQREGLERQEEMLSKDLADRERLLDESIEKHALEKTQLEEKNTTQQEQIKELEDAIIDLMQSDMKVNMSPEQLEELEKSKQTITDLQEELQFTNDALKQRDIIFEENEKAQEVIKSLQETIASLETNPKMTQAQFDELNGLQNKVKKLEGELMITKEDLEDEEERRTKEKTQLEEKINDLEDAIRDLMESDMKVNMSPEQLEELEKSKQTISELQEELQFTNDQLGKRDIIYEENVKAQKVITSLQETIASLETNPKMTETQANELNALKNRVKVLEDELMITKEELGDEEENRLTEKTQAAEHIEKQQDVIKKLQETITSLESNSNMTEQQLNDINDLREKITSLNEELTYVNSELKDRDEKLDEYESRGQVTQGEKDEKDEKGIQGKTMPVNVVQSNVEPTTETTRGLQEFVVRIKYPVPGSAEHVINVIGDSGTSTEANIMNISNELNAPAREEPPPPYTATGGSKNKRRNIGLFTADEFIRF